MLNSYRIFVGKTTTRNLAVYLGVCFAAAAAAGVVARFADYEPIKRFTERFLPVLIAIMVPSFCVGAVMTVYSANWRNTSTGFKFFHSLPDGARRFREAIIFVNVITAVIILCFAGLFAAMFGVNIALLSIAFSFFEMSMLNFTGHMRSVGGRVLSLVALGFAAGFYSGFFDDKIPDAVAAITAAACTVLFIAAVIISAVRAEAAWNREDEKCKE